MIRCHCFILFGGSTLYIIFALFISSQYLNKDAV
jgi:hypothetical protein